MTEQPIILLPRPGSVNRGRPPGGPGPKLHRPTADRQKYRLHPKFQRLAKAFQQRAVELRDDPSGVEPEMVLVLETAVDFGEFHKAVGKIEGLEWLADREETELQPDEDFYDLEDRSKKLGGRCYLIMSDVEGQRQLLSLWGRFRADPENPDIPHKFRKWKKVFKLLKDIRVWGPGDRLMDTGMKEDWQARTAKGEDRVSIEVELWYRKDKARREKAEAFVSGMIVGQRGRVVCSSTIDQILYHALLAELPITAVQTLVQLEDTHLVRCDDVMFFRPKGQAAITLPEDEALQVTRPPIDRSHPQGNPVVALLDGLPLENHELLAGRLVVDDPDNWASEYSAQERIHGTAMASLIINDELDLDEPPLSRPLYVRPIMRPDPQHFQRPAPESMPRGELHVDLVYRTVRRLFEHDGTEPAAAPTIKIINLSICDATRPFHQLLSPWAKLLDYLAAQYKVLFIVSIGNHLDHLPIRCSGREDIQAIVADPDTLTRRTMTHLLQDALPRRLLSPSEAVNVLTVGSTHCDSSTPSTVGALLDPVSGSCFPSPINKQGPGFRRAIKPEVLFKGGRQLYQQPLRTQGSTESLSIAEHTRPPGQQVAAPGRGGELDATRWTRGTSNATALVTRTAARVYELLEELRDQPGGGQLEDEWAAVIIKAILVHGATWGEAQELVRQHMFADGNADRTRMKAALARLLGYGPIDSGRLFRCTDQRVMLLGFQSLEKDQAHVYSVPIPSGLNGARGWRRLVVTLAWCTPTNPRNSVYRMAKLWFVPYQGGPGEGGRTAREGDVADLLNVRRAEVDWQAARRGTVQHEIFEGSEASSFLEDSEFQIQVNCAAESGDQLENIRIPYCLAITVEVGAELNISIYQEIRNRILVPILQT